MWRTILALLAVLGFVPHGGDARSSEPTVLYNLPDLPPRPKQLVRASWYGHREAGRTTASGRIFNPNELTAAHPWLSFGSKLLVTNPRTNKSVVVTITDRGPFIPGRQLDLSWAAAKQIGLLRPGVARVWIERLG